MSFFRGLIEAVYPLPCAACARLCSPSGARTAPFCAECLRGVERVAPFQIAGAESARALWAYGGPVAQAIHRFKYRKRPELGRPLGKALGALLEEVAPVDALVPVPLSPARLLDRGYNQARELARAMKRPVLSRALIRPIAREQVGLGKRARLANVAEANNAILPGPERVSELRLALVDDVVTTGATAAACVAALRRAGARSVSVLAVSRKL